MLCALLAPFTKFLKIKLPLDLFLVFDRVIVDPFTVFTFEANEMFLGHTYVIIR